jgi:hypothetical protein
MVVAAFFVAPWGVNSNRYRQTPIAPEWILALRKIADALIDGQLGPQMSLSRLEYVPAVNSILHASMRQFDENWRCYTGMQLKLQAHIQ